MSRGGYLARALDGNDRSVEAHSILATIAFTLLCLFQGYALYMGQGFAPTAFGEAVAYVLGGQGADALGQGALSRMTRRGSSVKPDNPDA
jgi:hypothetical protein